MGQHGRQRRGQPIPGESRIRCKISAVVRDSGKQTPKCSDAVHNIYEVQRLFGPKGQSFLLCSTRLIPESRNGVQGMGRQKWEWESGRIPPLHGTAWETASGRGRRAAPAGHKKTLPSRTNRHDRGRWALTPQIKNASSGAGESALDQGPGEKNGSKRAGRVSSPGPTTCRPSIPCRTRSSRNRLHLL